MEKVVLDFFKELLVEQYGKEIAENIIYNLIKPKKVTLRANTIKSNIDEAKTVLKAQNIRFKTVNWYKDALIIEEEKEDKIKELEIYKQGKVYLQSLSSMLPPLVLKPNPHENILDMAAAPRWKNDRDGSFV